MARILAALLMLLVTSGSLRAEEPESAVRVGDPVLITLRGEAANAYARCFGKQKLSAQQMVQVQISGRVRGIGKDGTVEIEHQIESEDPARIVTLRGRVTGERLATMMSPKGTPLASSPDGRHVARSTQERRDHALTLTDFQDFKLRAWAVEEEFGGEQLQGEAIERVRYPFTGRMRN